MKKIYILLLILFPAIANSQITITQADLPNVGWGYINATDSNYTAAILPGGTAQSWNYSTLLKVQKLHN